jgi:hypothetical protein
MNRNLFEFGQFKNRKSNTIMLNENVQAVDDLFRVRKRIDVPMALVNAFKKKVKDDSGKNISQFYSDVELAEEIADYIINTYVTIDNLPVNLILGDQYSKSQGGQAQSMQGQVQPGTEDLDETQPIQGQPQIQPQGQPQGQGVPQGQVAPPQSQQAQGAQRTAAQIPPMQGGQAI